MLNKYTRGLHKNKNIIIEFLGQIVDKGRLNEWHHLCGIRKIYDRMEWIKVCRQKRLREAVDVHTKTPN